MAEKLAFRSGNTQQPPTDLKNGEIYVQWIENETDPAAPRAELFIKLNDTVYQLKPKYNWLEILDDDYVNERLLGWVHAIVNDELQKIALRFVEIEKTIDDESENKTRTLDISISDNTNLVLTSGGSILHQGSISTGNTQGTINIAGEDVPVAGLGSAAYADSGSFVPIDVANWNDDNENIEEGGN